MNQCYPNLLFEADFFNITQCTKCKRIGLYYRNLVVGFHVQSFVKWGNALMDICFKRNARTFPSGEDHIILNTCHQDIQFTFTEAEFQEIREGVVQALLLLEAQALVKSN